METTRRQRGTVKWFSREKGWGFIRLENGDDIFVHHSDIIGEGFVSLDDGQEVEFHIEQMEKGPRAREVREVAADDSGGPAAPGRRDRSDRQDSGPAEASEAADGDGPAGARSPAGASEAADGDDAGDVPLSEQLRRRLARHFPGLAD